MCWKILGKAATPYSPSLNIRCNEELVRCFTVFDIEVRRGNLPEQALKKRSELIVAAYSNFSVEVDDDFIMKFREKYRKLLDLYEKSHCLMCDQLSDELLAQMLINGCYDSHKICQSLDQSHHFLMANAPSWRFIWSFVHLSEDVFSEKLKEFNEDFQMRRFVIPGEILHVFSLRLMLSTIGIIEDDKNKVVDELQQKYRDLCSKNNCH